MAENNTFTIKSRNETFRIGYVSPVSMLAISTQVDLDNFKKTETLFTFALEHIEVQMGEEWNPVKTPDKEVYMPFGIQTDFTSLDELCTYFLTEVIQPAFQNSSESD